VLATQTLPQEAQNLPHHRRRRTARGVTAKDIILAIIGQIGTDGATGCVIEYAGSAIRALSMEGRMTICNMSIEAGARAGMIAPDETTFAYLKGRRFSPARRADWDSRRRVVASCPPTPARSSTANSHRRRHARPYVSWGTSPAWSRRSPPPCPIPPTPSTKRSRSFERALEYMDLKPARRSKTSIDRVFIGSCTNGRIEDLRAAAKVAAATRSPHVRAMVVPGSQQSKRRPKPKASTRSSSKPASTGASPAAPCAWA
jgi:3-isopropylmalate/(R)-2-methylmalate dehydratase large subunit